jgi:hypothetical protein
MALISADTNARSEFANWRAPGSVEHFIDGPGKAGL